MDGIIEGGDTDPSNNLLPLDEENAGLDSFNVRLLAQPSQAVTVTTSVAAAAKIAAVNPAELIFDSFNWDDYQSFQVVAGDDQIVGSPEESYEVTVSVSGGPARFTVVPAITITSTIAENNDNNDDDLAGLTFSPASTLSPLAEDGTTMFDVALSAEPASDVVVTFSSAFADPLFSAVAAVSITNDVLTFTSGDWETGQAVQIGGIDNDLIGPLDYTITASVVSGPGNQNSGGL